jgi:hypothetical protein
MNKYRQKLHFKVYPENFFSKRFIDSGVFNNYTKTQLLVSLTPHEEKNECKFIFERHRRKKNNIQYEIRIKLYGYNKTRMRVSTDCYKKIVVREDETFDIIPDTMIFEECEEYDNYILVIEVIPQAFLQCLDSNYGYANPADPLLSTDSQNHFEAGRLKLKEEMLMSLSLYCWFQTDVVTIPFRERAQAHTFVLANLQKKIFKLEVKEGTEFEFRVEGFSDMKYSIAVSKVLKYLGKENEEEDLDSDNFISRNRVAQPKANVLTMHLDPGQYFLHLFESETNSTDNEETESSKIKKKYFKKDNKHYIIDIFAFNSNYMDRYNSSIERLETKQEQIINQNGILSKSKCLDRTYFNVNVVQKFGLNYTEKLRGQWSPSLNQGPGKFDLKILQSFHRNPGFIILLESDCQIKISVTPKDLEDPKCVYKLCVFELDKKFQPETVFEPDYFTLNKPFKSQIFYLSKNVNGYLILLVPKFKEFTSEFDLIIKSDNTLGNIKPIESGICHFPWRKEFPCEVKDYQGGTLKYPSFFLNRSFVFLINERANVKKEEIYIEVSSKDDQDMHLGVYVVPLQSPEQLFKLSMKDMGSVKMNNMFLPKINTFHFMAKPGYYMVIPTSYVPVKSVQPLQLSLKFFCSSQFTLSRNQEFRLKEVFWKKIREDSTRRFKVKINDKKMGLMLVLLGRKSQSHTRQVIDLTIGKVFA